MSRLRRPAALLLLALLGGVALARQASGPVPAPARAPAEASADDLAAIQRYIHKGWTDLERTHRQLLAAAVDPKFPSPGGRWPVYVPAGESTSAVLAALRREMAPADFAKIDLRPLPPGPLTALAAAPPGLLYLPRPYVVPGGRFNEMYGWDSYFILVGLLRDGKIERARDLVDNFLYEIENYGLILNANRSYYLTRSQPPLLTEMILGVYERTHDRAWLERTVPAIEKYYRYWTAPPHLVPETGLSRYYDLGKGPAPEVLSDEKDAAGRTHYDRIKAYYQSHPVPDYDLKLFYDAAGNRLTDLFYVADRSMRESGVDPSNRFGPFNIGVIQYNPVCLNSLLFRMELETAEILVALGRRPAAEPWRARAKERQGRIARLLWDERVGLFLDYNFTTGSRRNYPFATTFFALFAGVASPEQAARMVKSLPLLERAGGLATSDRVTGNQWDAPFGWAPLEFVAAKGLRRYGHAAEADRISINFLSLVLKEFLLHNAIFEKYDVEKRRSETAQGVRFGYSSNEIGFGWTNAAFAELYADLPEASRLRIRHLDGIGVGAKAPH